MRKAQPVVVTPSFDSERFLVERHIEVSGEVSKSVSLEEIQRHGDWKVIGSPVASAGFVDNAYWGRLSIQSNSFQRVRVFFSSEYAFFDEFSVYHLDAEGNLLSQVHLGDMKPFADRVVDSTGLIAPLELPANSKTHVYFRTTATENTFFNLHLWSEGGHQKHERFWYQIYAFLYGMLVVMIVYNFFLFVSTREVSYWWYTLYLTAHTMFLMAFRGFGYQYVWPESPTFNVYSVPFLSTMVGIFLLFFVRSYLRTYDFAPKFDLVIRVVIAICVVLVPVELLAPPRFGLVVATILLVPIPLILFVGAINMYKWGHKAALFFILAFGVLLANFFATALILLLGSRIEFMSGFDTSLEYLFATYGLELSVVVEATLLSIGVGYGISQLLEETEILHSRNLDLQQRATAELQEEVDSQTQALRHALEELEIAQAELVQHSRLATIGNLVSGVAHEIGNPLNLTIGGAMELEDILDDLAGLSSNDKALMEAAKRCAALVVRGSERIEVIVRNLNRLASTGQRPAQEICDPIEAIKATLEIVAHQLTSNNIELDFKQKPVPWVRANGGELVQVLLNIILNSSYAMEKTGGVIAVEATVFDEETWIDISDTGSGIPENISSQIFDAFFTTKEQGEGSGLGLSISHQMVSGWGGSLAYIPQAEGARFRIVLLLASGETTSGA